jgi:hypothetical protein
MNGRAAGSTGEFKMAAKFLFEHEFSGIGATPSVGLSSPSHHGIATRAVLDAA